MQIPLIIESGHGAELKIACGFISRHTFDLDVPFSFKLVSQNLDEKCILQKRMFWMRYRQTFDVGSTQFFQVSFSKV